MNRRSPDETSEIFMVVASRISASDPEDLLVKAGLDRQEFEEYAATLGMAALKRIRTTGERLAAAKALLLQGLVLHEVLSERRCEMSAANPPPVSSSELAKASLILHRKN